MEAVSFSALLIFRALIFRADPLRLFTDADEAATAAAIILQRRVDGITARRPT